MYTEIVVTGRDVFASDRQRKLGFEIRPKIAPHAPHFALGHRVKLRGILVDLLPHRTAVVDGKLAGSRVGFLIPVEHAGRGTVVGTATFGDDGRFSLLRL